MSTCLLLAGHGSHFDANSSAPVHALAGSIRAMRLFDEVRVASWKEEPSLARGLDGVGHDEVAVVPVFMSSGFFTETVLPRELGLDGPVIRRGQQTIRYTPPAGVHPSLAEVIVQRALEAGAGPGDALAVLGHGTPRNPNSETNIYAQAERVRATGRFREVLTVFLDQEPNMRRLFELTDATRVVLVPLFVADGWHVGESIPADLALDGPETRRAGRVVRYAKAVGTHPGIAGVVLELAAEALGRPLEPVMDVRDPAPPAWLVERWKGRQDFGVGELRVRFDGGAAIVEGPRPGPLVAPGELRAITRRDEAGNYRPLTGERNLPAGWSVRCETAKDLAEAIDAVYPLATVHVDEASRGNLRVVPFETTLARQGGRYGALRDIDAEALRDTRAAACARCVRVPVWDGASTVASGVDVAIPCPEACSILLERCREAGASNKPTEGRASDGRRRA